MFLFRNCNAFLLALVTGILLGGFLNTASAQPVGAVSLTAIVDLPGFDVTDVAAYVDRNTGIEYAIVGYNNPSGIVVVSLENPEQPVNHRITFLGQGSRLPYFDYMLWRSGSSLQRSHTTAAKR